MTNTMTDDTDRANASNAPLRAVRTPKGVELHPPEKIHEDHCDRLVDAVDEVFDPRTVSQLGSDQTETSDEIGTVWYDDAGMVVDIAVPTDHRKPSEKEDGRDEMAVFEVVADRDSTRNRSSGDLISLRKSGSNWQLSFGPEAREAGIEAGDYVVVDLEDPEFDPLLVIGVVPDPPENPKDDPFTRKVTKRGDTLGVTIPERNIDERGLGLSADEYDTENPLQFEPLVQQGLVGLAPVGYADGREYIARGHRSDSGPVDAAPDPNAEQVSLADAAPETPEGVGAIPAEAIQAASQLTGVASETVERALQLLADSLDVDALDAHHAEAFDPVETPDGTVHIVSRDVWSALDATQNLDASVQQAVRQAHTLAAETLLDKHAPESDEREFSTSWDALVNS